ncbi:type III pantothenate kinase [Candidatus Bipolaricaulota bacterium]|nr:type III pantothenate kinase [Candidatus Bipolaricaulota bacterium]
MLLTYDVGNTNIVVGLFDGSSLRHHWRFASDRNRTGDELRLATRSLLAEAEIAPAAIEGIAVASVVPSLNTPLRHGLAPLIDGPIRFLNADSSPIPLRVEQPGNVGADRIANCIAGHALYGGPLLVLDFGTAINFDLIAEDGAFLGGAIAPEMDLAARALTETAAQLHSVELTIPKSVIGKNTARNLQAGIVLGYLDLVAGLIARFRREVATDLPVLATGGRAQLFHEQLDAIDHYDAFLTQKGLQIWWERTAS